MTHDYNREVRPSRVSMGQGEGGRGRGNGSARWMRPLPGSLRSRATKVCFLFRLPAERKRFAKEEMSLKA